MERHAEEGRQGWTNWETWNVDLWISNDEGMYDEVIRACPPSGYTNVTAEELGRSIFPNGTPDMESPAEMDRVDWFEIADVWNAYNEGAEEDGADIDGWIDGPELVRA